MDRNRPIAIIGMAGRFPDAPNIASLHQNLLAAKCSIREISADRIQQTTLSAEQDYYRAGFVEGIDRFDHELFHLSLGEAQCMDPHQRQLLEVVYELMENAGYSPQQMAESDTSVFVADKNLYYYRHAEEYNTLLVNGNSSECLAAYLSRQFNLQGSTAVIDTSCSSSLVALHHACNELLLGDAERAIVCGASYDLFPFREGDIDLKVESPDGRSIPFSDRSNGMVYGEAAVAVLLKPLEQALADGDHIQATILSTAVNNNAFRSASLNAPDSVAQAQVLQKAWRKAGIEPSDLAFVEAHGSGTRLGDNIEVGGLNLAFAATAPERSACPISTIKANIGHTRCVAGLAGLVKVALALKHEVIYPAHYTGVSSPLIDFDRAAVYVNQEAIDWPGGGERPRVAGLSSFGFSGTNCHVVLAEAPLPTAHANVPNSAARYCIPLTAHHAAGLLANAQALLDYLPQLTEADLPSLSKVLGSGRDQHAYRRTLLVSELEDLRRQLSRLVRELTEQAPVPTPDTQVIGVFSDDASLVLGDLEKWGQRFPVFQSCFARGEALRRELGQSPTAAYCNLMFQWGLAEQLRAFGLAPQKLLGLGLGKQTAQLLRQERSLIECLQVAFTYEPEAITALEQRARRLLERESSVGATLFLSMNPRNPIVDQLAQLTTGEERLTCFNWSSAAPAAFGELLAALHRTGQTLDWSAAFDYLPARRMELPTSSFAPTRCWIRETPSDFSETESSSDTEALEADWTALQIGLATIWKRVLELETLQLQDDFFELGGDSLQATKVIQSLNHDYGLQLDFEDIFDFPTLEGLAQYIHENLSNVQRLMIAWKEVLKVDQIGLDEDFFSIGGHSLLANQILNRIDYYFGLRLDFEDFFKYPTIRGMADYLDHRQKVSRTIPVLPPSEHYALSPNQKRLWAVCQSEESAAAYNELNCYLLEGEVRPDLLERALAAVIERHESLRTVFVEHEGETRQKILPPRELNFQIDYRDLSQTPEARSVADAELVRFRQLPFNFQDGPLCKALLCRLEKGRYLLGLNIHHIVFDDWSFEIMSHEMAIHYRALLKGQGSPLRPLEFQYKEMAAWMNTELSGERLLAQEKFWLDKLAAPLPVLELPTDFPRPVLKTFKGAKERYTIGAELIDAIRRVSQREGVSVFMTLTTALLVQLHRYSGQKELILGLPVAGRGLLELENQVGFYTNTVSLLTRWEEDLRLSDFLQLVKENMLDVYRHQLYPLDALVEQLDRRVDQSRGALFDLLVVYKKVTEGGEPLDLPFSIQIEEAKQLHSGFDLEFSWIELPDGLEVSIIYNPDLYRQTTIDRYFTHFRNLLQHFTTDLEVRLNTLDYLGAAERAQLRAPAPSQSPSPTDRAFHGLMERAAQSPQALAIAYGRQRYTYAELWENVQLRMAELHAREASPQQKLALYFTDRYEAISTLWAALYLGHDCLLLPNDWPSPYVQAFLQELNPTALLSDTAAPVADASTLAYSHYRIGSQSADEATLPTPASTPGRLLLWESETAEGPQVHPLSGTRLLAQLDWLEEHLVFDAHTVLLQTTSPSSPLGLLEILATLRRGGTLVLSDQDQPAELLELINTRGVTHWCFDPQELEAILTLGETPSESLWSLRQAYTYLVEGAEETRKKLARTASPQQWQCYGHPALAPLVAAGPWTPESESLFCAPVLPGLAVELRDAAGQLLPLGTWGDLYQATAPARTRGDRLRWTEVGQLEWWGSQVAWSLRGGQRLAEEAWATRLLGERKDILLALRTIAGEMRAYLAPPVVGQALPERLVEEWQREWRARYPKAWLPDCIHQLDHLPQTETGRVDWTAIDRWERERELAANYTEPRGELEVKIHQIWSTVLHVDRIGVHDNFFEIGGNSLLSLRITSMIYRDLALKLSMTDVFEHPTIRQLAQRVGDRRVEPVAAIPVAPSADQYVLSRAQRRMWILSHLGEGTATYNMYKTCRVRGPVDRQRLEEAFRALIRRQESLRTAIVVVDGEAFSRIRPAAELPFKLRYRDYTDAEIPLEKAK
ncbi:MAG: condensation domain-containing protein, partial [Bacteroidota bacterium]